MDFASVAWWAYALTALGGLAFGLAQSFLMKRALLGDHPRKWLYAVKLGLWAVALVMLAILSVVLLLVFVATATGAMLVGSALFYRKAQKEAR